MRRNPWPYAIIAYFAVFIAAMASWITFAVRNDMDLVRSDYYEREIKFQDQLDRIVRTAPFRDAVSLTVTEGKLNLTLPARDQKGEIYLYRPSDAKQDRRYVIEPGAAGTQKFDLAGTAAGYWKAQVSWSDRGQEFFVEKALVLAGE